MPRLYKKMISLLVGILLWGFYLYIVFVKTKSPFEFRQLSTDEDVVLILLGITVTIIVLTMSRSFWILALSLFSNICIGELIASEVLSLFDFYIAPTFMAITLGIALFYLGSNLLEEDR